MSTTDVTGAIGGVGSRRRGRRLEMRLATIIAVGAAALVTACGASSGTRTHGTATSTTTTTTATVTQTTTSTTTTTAVVGPHTTVEPGSAEDVIRTNIVKFGSIQAKSVSCPGGVEKVDGAKLDCQVTLLNTSTGATASGTITLHVVNGGTEAVFSGGDIKVK